MVASEFESTQNTHKAAGTSAIVTLMVTTAGATGTWLIHGPKSTAAYPGTILVLVASLAWLQQAVIRRDSQTEHPETLSG